MDRLSATLDLDSGKVNKVRHMLLLRTRSVVHEGFYCGCYTVRAAGLTNGTVFDVRTVVLGGAAQGSAECSGSGGLASRSCDCNGGVVRQRLR